MQLKKLSKSSSERLLIVVNPQWETKGLLLSGEVGPKLVLHKDQGGPGHGALPVCATHPALVRVINLQRGTSEDPEGLLLSVKIGQHQKIKGD